MTTVGDYNNKVLVLAVVLSITSNELASIAYGNTNLFRRSKKDRKLEKDVQVRPGKGSAATKSKITFEMFSGVSSIEFEEIYIIYKATLRKPFNM